MLERHRVHITEGAIGLASVIFAGFLLLAPVALAGDHPEQVSEKTAEAGQRSQSVAAQSEAYQAAFKGEEDQRENQAPDKDLVRGPNIEEQRSDDSQYHGQSRYYRAPQSNSNYGQWMEQNPRYSHPVHEMVHGRSWSENRRDYRNPPPQESRNWENREPQGRYGESPEIITNEDITYDPNNWDKFYPYPRSRVIWYNDRYYPSGKYYPHTNMQQENPRQQQQAREDGAMQRGAPGERGPASAQRSDRQIAADESRYQQENPRAESKRQSMNRNTNRESMTNKQVDRSTDQPRPEVSSERSNTDSRDRSADEQ
ncbi:MAG: hypothetical protein KC994_22235 [Candidatus Omnitrophica bacterium]|nr:hypothetical protein [Candidatus Omnitrophota bacterium]